jgi:hypothetical protein
MNNTAEIAALRKGISVEQAKKEIAAITDGKSAYMADLAIRNYLEMGPRYAINDSTDFDQIHNAKE